MGATAYEQLNKRALFIGLVWPEPTSTAAGQNIISYIKLLLDTGFEITFASAAQKTEQSAALAAMGVMEQVVTLNDSSFDAFVSLLSPEIVIFDRFITEEQFGWRVSSAAPNCMKVLDCEDLHFLRDARHQEYKQAKQTGLHKDLIAERSSLLFSDICKRELASIMRCDLSVLLSDVEYQLLTNVFGVPSTILHCCPFLLKTPVNRVHKSFEERADFVSIGSFRHAPNWDAVLTIKQTLWPAIRKALPKAKCHIYGSYLTPKAKQLENAKEGFLVHGYTADALEAIGNAKVLLAPLNFGAGIKGKLVDAMQCRTPSITTAIGSEGLLPIATCDSQWPGAIHDIRETTQAFIEASIALHSNKEKWTEASSKGKSLFNAIFQYESQSTKLLNVIESITKNLSAHRQQHFLGQVMQHHTLNSTKYMSQWIEAKTRLAAKSGA